MGHIPAGEQLQIIQYLAEEIETIPDLDGQEIAIEFQRGTGSLVIKANGGPYKQKKYINGSVGDFVGEFAFTVMNTVEHSDGQDSVLLATAPLLTISEYFDTLDVATLDIGDGREPLKVEMTAQPADLAGLQENGKITFFAVYTLTYRKKGA